MVEGKMNLCQVAKSAGSITKEISEFHFRCFTTSWNLQQAIFLTREGEEKQRNTEIVCWEFRFCSGSGLRLSLQFRYDNKNANITPRRYFNDFWNTRKGWLRKTYRFVTLRIDYIISIQVHIYYVQTKTIPRRCKILK